MFYKKVFIFVFLILINCTNISRDSKPVKINNNINSLITKGIEEDKKGEKLKAISYFTKACKIEKNLSCKQLDFYCQKYYASYGKILNIKGVINNGVVDDKFFLLCNNGAENSLIEKESKILSFFDPSCEGALFKSELKYLANRYDVPNSNIISHEGFRFSYVFTNNSHLFMVATRNPGVFLFESFTNGKSWVIRNNGKPILTKSNNKKSIFYNIWNAAVDIDSGGVWHMLVEVQEEAEGQSKVGLAYLTAKESSGELNFDHNRKEEKSIPLGGNPFIKIVDDKILAVYGSIENSKYWQVTASVFFNGKWNINNSNFLISKENIHVADPALIEINNQVYMTMSYDQRFTIGVNLKMSFKDLVDKLML